jgi:hypothetical protein
MGKPYLSRVDMVPNLTILTDRLPHAQSKGTAQIRRYMRACQRLDNAKSGADPDSLVVQACIAQVVRVLESSESAACAYLQFELGNVYYFGEYGVDEDTPKALEHWQIAASMGYSLAWYNIARDKERGGCDCGAAVACYEDAAEPCDCWPGGNCATDDDNDTWWHRLKHCSSYRAQTRLAEAYEGVERGAGLLKDITGPGPYDLGQWWCQALISHPLRFSPATYHPPAYPMCRSCEGPHEGAGAVQARIIDNCTLPFLGSIVLRRDNNGDQSQRCRCPLQFVRLLFTQQLFWWRSV